MPKVTILHSHGTVQLADMPERDLGRFLANWEQGKTRLITIDLDTENGQEKITLARTHIIRVDVTVPPPA